MLITGIPAAMEIVNKINHSSIPAIYVSLFFFFWEKYLNALTARIANQVKKKVAKKSEVKVIKSACPVSRGMIVRVWLGSTYIEYNIALAPPITISAKSEQPSMSVLSEVGGFCAAMVRTLSLVFSVPGLELFLSFACVS